MLNYKQIWHGIKPIRWLNKFNLTNTNKNGHAYNNLVTILEIATLAINKNSTLILVEEKTLLKKVPQNQVLEKSVKMNIQTYHTMITNSIKIIVLVIQCVDSGNLFVLTVRNSNLQSLKLCEYYCINNFDLTIYIWVEFKLHWV